MSGGTIMKTIARYITTMLLVLTGTLTVTAQNDPFLPDDPGRAKPHHKLKIVSTEAFNIIIEVYTHTPNGNMIEGDINITHSDANITMTLAEGDSIKIWNRTYTWSGWEYTYMEMDGKKIHENQHLESYSVSDMPTIVMPNHDATIYVHAKLDPSTPGWEQADNPYSGMWNAETGELFVNNFVPYFPDGSGSSYQNKKGYLLSGAIWQILNSYNVSSSDVKILTINGEMGICSYYAGYLGFENTHTIDLRHTYGYKSYYGLWYDEKSWYDNIFDQAVYSPSLKRLILPSNIQGIGDGVFGYQQIFGDNWKLEELTCYAVTPPMLNENTLSPLPTSCVLCVPEQAVAAYKADKYWSRFKTIKGIQEAEDVTVDLPDNFTDGRYRGMSLELLNAENGESRKYVVDERGQYVYRGLVNGARYTALLRSTKNGIIAQTDTMLLDNQPIEMTFPKVVGMEEVLLTVKADGKDVTDDVTIGWTDRKGNRIGDGKKLDQQIEGSHVYYAIKLPSQLATLYQQPSVTEHIVGTNRNVIALDLLPLDSVSVSGVVRDIDGNRIGGATVVVAQTVNGQISKSFITTTDASGRFSLKALAGPVARSVSATGYITNRQEMTLSNEIATTDTITLATLSGAIVTYDFTYTESVLKGETASTLPSYSDYQNVSITAYNETTGKQLTDISVQYPQVVIISGTKKGDRIRLTATSLNGSFKAVEQTVTLGDDEQASVTIAIVQYGGIEISFEQTDNSEVTASLYNSDGKLYQTYDYNEAIIRLTEIPDGKYTIVTMGGSTMFSSILSLNDYTTVGLKEGTDYIKNEVTVKSGEIVTVVNKTIPVLNESGYFYTEDTGTSFKINKTEVGVGYNVTLRATLGFKPEYRNKVSNVSLIVDLPTNGQMVEGSAMTGTKLTRSSVSGNRVTIPISIDDLAQNTRFAVATTAEGSFTPTAYVQFKVDGREVLQPIGTVSCNVKGMTINVPEIICELTLPVQGTAPSRSFITIYTGNTELGQTTAREDGSWISYVELPACPNPSKIPIHCKMTTKQGLEFYSQTATTTYDQDYVQVDHVYMWYLDQFVDFDFNHPDRIEDQSYTTYMSDWYTFAVEFNTTDSAKVANPTLYVKKTDGEWDVVDNLTYNKDKGWWMGTYQLWHGYGICNVDVDYGSNAVSKIDREAYDGGALLTQAVSQNMKDEAEWIESELNRIMNIKDDAMFREEMDALFDELGIEGSWEGSGEPDIEKWLEDIDNVFKDDDLSEMLSNWDIYNNAEMGKMVPGITVRYATGLTPAILESDGYIKMETTSGLPIYMLVTETQMTIVDLENNQVIDYQFQGEMGARMRGLVKAARANDGSDFLTKLAELQDAVNGWLVHAKALLTGMATKVIDLVVDGYLRNHRLVNIQRQLAEARYNMDFLRKTGRLAKFPEVTKKVAKLSQEEKTVKGLMIVFNKLADGPDANIIVKTFCNPNTKWGKLAAKVKAAMQSTQLTKTISWLGILTDIVDGIAHLYHLGEIYTKIPNPCPEDESNAKSLKMDIGIYGAWVCIYYAALEVFNVGVLDGMATATATLPVGLVIPFGLVAIEIGKIWGQVLLERDYERRLVEYRTRLDALECEGDNENWKKRVRAQYLMEKKFARNKALRNKDLKVGIDPSGFIYEGVTDNRVENATTTIYYKNEGYDEWGDYHNEAVKWNAAEFGQQNPLQTDKEGKYQWFVPNGLWQVKVEKDGYETAYSDWLPVPPPQLDVNIGIVQKALPDIKTARAYEDGIEVEFNKYMRPKTLNANTIWLTQGSQKIACTIEHLNSGKAWDSDSSYVSRLLLRPSGQLSVGSKIGLFVRRQVESYAGLQMQNDYEQEFVVVREIRNLEVEPQIEVDEGKSRTFVIKALPGAAASGKRVTAVITLNDFITLNETAEFNSNGEAQFTVNGLMPGETVVTFVMEETSATVQTIIRVLGIAEAGRVAAPTASRISGTSVNKGETVTLHCATEGAQIWYTLDGSCPCDENGTRQLYTNPITISQEMELKAYAVKGENVSEVVSFHYYIATGIHSSKTADPKVPVAYYAPNGQKMQRPQKGINIVHYSDGSSRKIAAK